MHNSRWIFQTMVLSLALNVALLGVFFYFLIRNNPLHFSYRPKEEVNHKHPPLPPQFLAILPSVPFEQLVNYLKDERKLDNGMRVREAALGALASYHDFDVERGLGRGKLSKQIWEQEESRFTLYPGLTSADFQTLQTFAGTEKWPYTTAGLFKQIKKIGVENCDPALLSFFCHRSEFVLVETLFARTKLPIQKRNVLNLVLEAGWDRFSAFVTEQESGIDLTDEARQKLIVSAIEEGSRTAAYLLLLTDNAFAAQQLDDRHLAQLLDLLAVKTPEALQFVQTIASSQRIAPVKQRAVNRIAEYTGHNPQEVAGHFVEKPVQKDLRPVFRQAPPAAPDPATHIVQDGESLWLIARKYKVSVDALKEINHLQSGVIRPGKSLKIPH